MTSPLNEALLKLRVRAERYDRSHIVQTFVDVGPLFTLLQTEDHQILYGRRGTGKTHAFEYLANAIEDRGDVAVSIDMRTIGSSGGLYSDPKVPISERATHLLVDTLLAVHESVLGFVVNADVNLAALGPLLDAFADAATEVSVVGTVMEEEGVVDSSKNAHMVDAMIGTRGSGVFGRTSGEAERRASVTRSTEGVVRHRVHFGTLRRALEDLSNELLPKRVWILLDEWSEVPLELQPYLADLIRRSLLPSHGVTVKIAAIEQRTNFQIDDSSGGYIGIEVGADATANVNLDDFMVFDNDPDRAKTFFESFLFKHVSPILSDRMREQIDTPTQLVSRMFTQVSAFSEFVRAAEGVPRDAINILSLAAQRALDGALSVPHVRVAAKKWYEQGKEKAVRDDRARALLRWVIDEVIGHRQARAFLVRSDLKYSLIDYLFDARVLHIVKHGVSAHDQPGVRYDVYSIDYGCYVDLINTARGPRGLFQEGNDMDSEYVEVPVNDYRSIRRAILDIDKFEREIK